MSVQPRRSALSLLTLLLFMNLLLLKSGWRNAGELSCKRDLTACYKVNRVNNSYITSGAFAQEVPPIAALHAFTRMYYVLLELYFFFSVSFVNIIVHGVSFLKGCKNQKGCKSDMMIHIFLWQ